ncbi:MAG: ribonuclease III [Clostridiales bacterium]|jgi:ribonuclease-3 family protein|nr:ribonuclease III [Clostridiales bacterium]
MAFNEYLGGDPSLLSPLNLAFVGDAVYSLLVRTRLVAAANRPAHALNKQASAKVCAVRQSADYYYLLQFLSDEELSVLKRGRNANPSQKAKNASIAEYRNATGLETLFGYLYLKGDFERMMELFNLCWSEDANEA